MTTLAWNGGSASFLDQNAWTPAEVPAAGDTLVIGTGTAEVRGGVLSALTIDLETQSTGASSPPAAPVLSLWHTTVAASTTISLGGVASTGSTTATTDVRGHDLNLGTITNTSFVGIAGPDGSATTLAIDVGGGRHGGVLVNAGTLSVTARPFAPSTMVVEAASHGATLKNDGLISSDGIIRLDIDVIGRGTIAFGPVFEHTHDGPPGGATVEVGGTVGAGQTVDFGTGMQGPFNTGTDSHGALILGNPGDFRGLIANFAASAGNFGDVHPDEIVLQGVDVTAFSYWGDAQGGVLTLREEGKKVESIRFAGNYSTDEFQITHPTASSSVIELKPAG